MCGGAVKLKKHPSDPALPTRALSDGSIQFLSMNRRTAAGSRGVGQTVPAGVQGERTRNGMRNPSEPVDVVGGTTGSQ